MKSITENFMDNLKKCDRLKLLRRLMKVRQNDMADFLKMDQSNYSKIENGFGNLKESHLAIIEKHFVAWHSLEVQRLEKRIVFINNVLAGNVTGKELLNCNEFNNHLQDDTTIALRMSELMNKDQEDERGVTRDGE